jgi:hypothetical protein
VIVVGKRRAQCGKVRHEEWIFHLRLFLNFMLYFPYQ